jgi:hypothetical protein
MMPNNKLEQKALDKANELNEGFFTNLFRNLFMSSSGKRAMKKAAKIAKDDPELQSALADLQSHRKRVGDLFKKLCKRNPDHPKC